MKHFFKIPFLILGVLLSIGGYAQTVQVLEKSALMPLENVRISSGEIQTSTNVKGEADLSAFSDEMMLTFHHVSFQPYDLKKSELAARQYKIYLTEKIISLEEVVFSASKTEEKMADVAQKIEVISARQIAFQNPQTSADLLQQSGNVFVQQSQMGGGSPVLRGFEANKVLLVVDGVRMNNAIYRGGHLQNAITIDPNMLDRVEVVFGPGSVIYGSDALGGVMHFYTRNPEFATADGKMNFNGRAFTRYASANSEKTGSLSLNFGFKKLAFLTSLTYKDFDDLRAGGQYRKGYENYWKLNNYSEYINGKDSVLTNPDPNVQRGTGYMQYDLMQKIAWQPNDNARFLLNVQYSNSSDVPRYDRLTERDNKGLPRFAEWYYGPQKRFFTSLRADLKGTGFYDRATIILAAQQIEESRISRRLNSSNKDSRIENVGVYSLNVDLNKEIGEHELRYGVEATYNQVDSKANRLNIKTGKQQPLDTRYPDGGSEMQGFALYLTHNWEMGKSHQWIFSQGLRYSYVSLTARFNDKTFFPFPYDKANQSNSALNGNLSLVYLPSASVKVSALVSSGFRAPNVDDLAKVFESQQGRIVVPNPNLRPEYTYNAELGVTATVANRLTVDVSGFYTWYRNAIIMRNFNFEGRDSIEYNGTKSVVQSNVNAGQAYLYGFQGNAQLEITKFLFLKSSLTYTYARVTSGEKETPLDHIPPVYGRTSLLLEAKKLKAEFYAMYNGWKRLEDYSPSGEDNLVYATPDGMPSWYTLNLRAGYRFNQKLGVDAAVENLLDRHYRFFASGVSAPGRNFRLTLRANF